MMTEEKIKELIELHKQKAKETQRYEKRRHEAAVEILTGVLM